jgi:hypothetical protein
MYSMHYPRLSDDCHGSIDLRNKFGDEVINAIYRWIG